jgi:hypothetical protein
MVKGYAGSHQLTMGEALQLLVSRGVAAGITTSRDPALGVLRDMPDRVLAELVGRVRQELARRNALSPEERQAEEADRLRAIGAAIVGDSTQEVDLGKLMAEYLRGLDSEP